MPRYLSTDPNAGTALLPKGQIAAGNIDLMNRPKVPNPNGGTSTVYSASFNIDGKEVLLPLSDEGRILSENEAVAKYKRTGKHLGIFATPAAATAYASQLHKDYEAGKYESGGYLSTDPKAGVPLGPQVARTRSARAADRELTDRELLAVFDHPKADLSLLTPTEQNRLVKLTDHLDRPSAANLDRLSATLPKPKVRQTDQRVRATGPRTFEVIAPNGKTLEITGDRVPTEAELREIFAAAGVDSVGDRPVEKLGALNRFLESAVKNNPITTGVDFLTQMATDPKGAGAAVINPSVERIQRGHRAAAEGRPLAALGNYTAAIPMIGPYIGDNIERAQGGDVAGAMGALSWLASPVVKRGARATVAGAKRLAPETMNRVAGRLDAGATERAARFISPQTGPNKIRLGNQAAEAAPAMLRDPQLGGVTRGGVAGKIARRLDEATEGLDVAADSRLASQQVRTRPLLAELDKRIAELTAQPVEASAVPRKVNPAPSPTRAEQIAGITGELTDAQAYKAEPYGKAVEPAPNSAEIATLRKIRDEVSSLGPVAPYESIRRIRQSWDKVAQVKYMPATAADALKSKGDATAAAKGTSAMREALAKADPTSAAAYQQYSLYKTLDDVVRAAEEADRVRPNRGRAIMARTAGAMIGGSQGGMIGAGFGAFAAAMVDKVAEMAPSTTLVVARKMAAMADALRAGNVEKATALRDSVVLQFPAVRGGLKIAGRTSALAGRMTAGQARLAAERNDVQEY